MPAAACLCFAGCWRPRLFASVRFGSTRTPAAFHSPRRVRVGAVTIAHINTSSTHFLLDSNEAVEGKMR